MRLDEAGRSKKNALQLYKEMTILNEKDKQKRNKNMKFESILITNEGPRESP